jgi:hypothetical protein
MCGGALLTMQRIVVCGSHATYVVAVFLAGVAH